jgi:uncharacterized protein (TIGR03000 family)
MIRKTFAFGGTLLVAAALGFLTPGPAHAAQPPRGFRAPMAPPRPPAMRFAPPAARPVGSFHFGGYRVGFVGGYHYRPSYGRAVYYPYHGGDASYYPYSYNHYLYYSYSPDDYSYLWSGPLTYPGSDPSRGSILQAQLDSRQAHVTVTVPDGARVWIDGTATTSTGRVQEYVTLPLAPGERPTYWVRARWNERGQEVNQLQSVEVTAGGHFDVRFPAPSRTGE